MITNFELENFKAFSHKQALRLAPITLIYGPNSSGKSSVIQALMMLQQTMLAKDKQGELVTSGDSINLGTFESLVHRQDSNKKLSFSIEYTSQHDAQEYRQRHSYDMLFANADIRKLEISYENKNDKTVLTNYSFKCGSKNLEKVSFQLERKRDTSIGPIYSLTQSDSLRRVIGSREKIAKDDGKAWNSLADSLSQPFYVSSNLNLPTSVNSTESALSSYTNKVIDDFSYVVGDLKYLGPLRSSPKRFYSDAISSYQRGQGKNNLGLEIYKSSATTKDKMNSFLAEFNIPYKIDVEDLGNVNSGPLISIQLTDLRNGAVVTPKDVGFGIGQVLPIILEAIVSKKKLICVEQPEIHLHPRLQAHLADLFIESVSANHKNQWIIETHSEALMLRIQRRIREGTLPKEMVSVLYVDVGDLGAQVTELKLDDEGDFLTHWPNGFFEERVNEMFGL